MAVLWRMLKFATFIASASAVACLWYIIAHIASGSKILGSIGEFVEINHIPYVHEKGKKESVAA